jgi:hypothetical protein
VSDDVTEMPTSVNHSSYLQPSTSPDLSGFISASNNCSVSDDATERPTSINHSSYLQPSTSPDLSGFLSASNNFSAQPPLDVGVNDAAVKFISARVQLMVMLILGSLLFVILLVASVVVVCWSRRRGLMTSSETKTVWIHSSTSPSASGTSMSEPSDADSVMLGPADAVSDDSELQADDVDESVVREGYEL